MRRLLGDPLIGPVVGESVKPSSVEEPEPSSVEESAPDVSKPA